MFIDFRRCNRWVVIAILLGSTRANAQAIESTANSIDLDDYAVTVSTLAWAKPPAQHFRLFLDVYNVTDFFDAETGGQVGFADHTVLADTIRPTATVLWGDRVRIQVGLIAEKAYGTQPSFDSVDAWLQLLWKPVKPLSVVMGNLEIPHNFYPALFYPANYFLQNSDPTNLPKIPQLAVIPSDYFTQSTNETGAQLIFKRPHWYDDLFFNYITQDVPADNEKFALGFVHKNTFWDWLSLNYQSHWIHYGGQFNPHPIETRNDVAQAAGAGAFYHPFHLTSLVVGGNYTYYHSHLRQEASDPANAIPTTNGNGNLWQAVVRWSRLKLTYGYWRGHNYYHEGGDPMFILPDLDIATARWDILLSRDFNLAFEAVGYFVGNNDLGYTHDLKSTFHLQATWHFSIPLMEWNGPAAYTRNDPIPEPEEDGL